MKLKQFTDDFLLPVFYSENREFSRINGENIQIFYDKFKVFANPTLKLFCENDDLIKHARKSQ